MYPLLGYVDRWSVKPGERITVRASSAGDAPFEVRFARVICGDPNPNGPGYREIPMEHPLTGVHAGREQAIHLGSWGEISTLDLSGAAEGLSLTATIWPTTPRKGRQGLISWIGETGALSLEIDADGAVAVEVTSGGATQRLSTGKPLMERAWYDVWAIVDLRAGRVTVGQRPRADHPLFDDDGATKAPLASTPKLGPGRVILAASPTAGEKPTGHYNGKLERPSFWSKALPEAAALSAQTASLPEAGASGLLACWDFSIGIDTLQVTDIGPQQAHGALFNLPTRAMTGANWSGREHRWTHAPAEWAAIHFHDDDVGDVGWAPSLEIDIPADWASGAYAIHLKSAQGVDNLPFVVRPGDHQKRADIAFLQPTVTYHVYGNFVRAGFGKQNRERAIGWGAITQTPDDNPEVGLSPYNYHSDGSGVSIASMFRPMVDKRFNQFMMLDTSPDGSGTYWMNSDSYVHDWMNRAGFSHDTVTDHDLHAEGAGLLDPYRVVICGQHPEYHTTEMLDALEAFLAKGGRLIYLGGNGFYWKTVFNQSAPYALEVRRAENGIRIWATDVAEDHHAFDGTLGGLWRRLGRPAHRLVGNGFASQAHYSGHPYTVNDAVMDPRVSFLREGIESLIQPGAVLGMRGHMGGGAAGHELDRFDVALGSPRHALVVATANCAHVPGYEMVNEDRLGHTPPRPLTEMIRADMTFFETPAGGAVFSVGSMSFVGSLPIDSYRNPLTRMMTNVLRRFADPTPFKV